MSGAACLNGKHCVDTFLDLEKFYDSIDNVNSFSKRASSNGIPSF